MDRSAKPIFNFVNLSHPDELKNADTQLRIRRLAMTEVGKARRKPKTKRERNEIVLEFRKPVASPSAIDRLGGGGFDPFSPYPIDLDESSRGLITFSKSYWSPELPSYLPPRVLLTTPASLSGQQRPQPATEGCMVAGWSWFQSRLQQCPCKLAFIHAEGAHWCFCPER
jgi:hypothetical protein